MRQSNSAIKYLMAQYSAIIKHAYVKGIASAVVLGAGLTATTSQAAENNGATSPKDSDSLGNSEYADGNTVPSNIKIRGGASKLFDVRTVAFNKASSANNDLGSELKGAAEDQLGGTVHVSSSVIPGLSDDPIKANVVNITSKETFRGNNTTHYSRNLNIKSGGKLSLVDTPLYVNGNLNMLGELYVYGDGSDIVLGSDQVKDTAYTNSKLNMKSGSRLDIKNSSGIKAAVGEVNSGTVVLRGEGSYIYAYGNGSSWKLSNPQDIKEGDVAGANLKFNKSRLDINGKSGYVGSLNNVSFKDSELNLNGENSAVEALGHNLQQEPSAGLKFDNTKIVVRAKEDASANAVPRFVAPNITFENGTNLAVGSDATLELRGAKENDQVTASNIKFKNSTLSSSGTVRVLGNMHIDSGSTIISRNGSNIVVDSLGNNNINNIVYQYTRAADDEQGYGRVSFDKTQTLRDHLRRGGNITLKSGGVLNFNEVTDLASFNYSTDSNVNRSIVLDQTADTFITGKDLTLSEALKSNDQVLSGAKLHVKADHVTLGDDRKLAPQDGNFGVDTIVANDLTLKSSGKFVLGHEIKLEKNGNYFKNVEPSYVELKRAQAATLDVPNDLQLGSNEPAGKTGSLKVASGNWDTAANIRVEKGSIDVSSKPIDAALDPVGNPTVFTLKGGKLDFNGTTIDAAKLSIAGASGASAVVDLREANLDFAVGSGAISVAGSTDANGKLSNIDGLDRRLKDYYEDNEDVAAYAVDSSKVVGYGMVKLKQDQFKDLTASASKVGINVSGGGIVTVDDFNGDVEVKRVTGGTGAQAGKVVFNNGQQDAVLSFGKGNVNFKAYDGEGGNVTLDLGSANAKVVAGSMDLTRYNRNTGEASSIAFRIDNSHLEASSAVSSKNKELLLAQDAVLSLKTDNVGDAGTVQIASGTNGVNGQLRISSGASFKVERGNWNADKVDIVNTGDFKVSDQYGVKDLTTTTFKASNYLGGNGKRFSSEANTEVEFDSMQLQSNHELDIKGRLLINGIDKADIVSGSSAANAAEFNGVKLTGKINVSGADSLLEFGRAAATGLIKYDSNTGTTTITNALKNADFNVNYGKVRFDLASSVKLDEKTLEALKQEILGSGIGGILGFGDADLGDEIPYKDLGNGFRESNWSDLKDRNYLDSITNDELMNTVINVDTDNAKTNVKGHYAALKGSGDITLGGNTSLNQSEANDSYFASNSNNGEAANIIFDKGASLSLVNGGKIGSITGDGTSDATNTLNISNNNRSITRTEILGDVTKLSRMNVYSDTNIQGKFDGEYINLAQAYLDIQGDMNLKRMVVESNGNITAKNAEIVAQGSGQDSSVILGNAKFENLNLKSQANDINALGVYGTLSTHDLVMDSNMQNVGINVGSFTGEDDPSIPDINESKVTTGNLEVKGRFTFGDGSNRLVVATDPSNSGVSYASLSKLSGAGTSETEAGTLDGQLFVGGNSAVGIGTSDLANLKDSLKASQTSKSVPEGSKATLYLAKSMKIGSGGSMIIAGDKGYSELCDYIAKANQANNISNPRISYDATNGFKLRDQTIYLGGGGAIVVDQTVAENADTSKLGDKAVAMIGFEDTGASGVVIADGGKIHISGAIREAKYKVFDNAEIEYLDQTDYNLADANYADKQIEITTGNGFVHGYLDENGEVNLKVNERSSAILARATRSVHDTLVDYVDGYRGQDPVYGHDANGNQSATYGNDLLEHDTNGGNGEASEQGARMGVYGGSAQAALAVADTSANAINSRFGVGSSTTAVNVTKAKSSSGFGLWAAPVYNTKKSSGFNNEDKAYGVDVNLGGVAVGGDFEVAPNLRVGAMVNVGKGSVDGNQIASNVSNDFNYYGVGAYVGYEGDKLSVVGDISYSVVDNDISATNDFEKLHSSFNTKNLSMGVTGQYVFDVGNDMVIVPHAGLRFNRVDLENYSVSGSKKYTEFGGDTLNTLSLPVGVKLAKNFVTDEWTMTPSVDLTLTSNFGDTSVNGSTSWVNNKGVGMIQNLDTHINSQILDDFTYGIGAGFSATNGAFSAGMGLNYTGSSNTDEFGVQANVRMEF